LRGQRWSWVHIADVADAFIRVVKHTNTLKGEAINIVSSSSPSFEQISVAAAKLAGFKGEIYPATLLFDSKWDKTIGTIEFNDEPGKDFFSTLANKTVITNYKKAEDLLGWTPSHFGLLEELELYYHALRGEWKN